MTFEHRDVRENALALLTASEGFVPYVYDDMAKKVNGKPPRYKGGPVIGTLTQGFGHTDMAGPPKLDHNLPEWTREYALEILNTDLDKYEDEVSRIVKVPLNDNQFGALVDFNYNCGAGNTKKLCVKLNEGDYDDVPVRMMLYTKSKGKTLPGLVKRRQAEAALWRSYIDVAAQQAEASEVDITPKIETRPTRSIVTSQEAQGTAAGTALNTGNSAIQTGKDVIEQVRDFKDAVGYEPDWLDYIGIVIASPWFWVGVAGVAIGGYVIYRRYKRLQAE